MGGGFLRIRVFVNITKPLKRGTCLSLPGTEQFVVLFKYERLPDICFVCGRLDHHETECDLAFQMKKQTGSFRRDYGAWLSADSKHPLTFMKDSKVEAFHIVVMQSPVRHDGNIQPFMGDAELAGTKGKTVALEVNDESILREELVTDFRNCMTVTKENKISNMALMSISVTAIALCDELMSNKIGPLSVHSRAVKRGRGRPSNWTK
ncbi:hypothetical protein REPUB_Repub07fG0167400 [Reevesia pubescens]